MSKKLLEESTIRSFMKLANLQPLTDKFLKESEQLEEEQLDEEESLEEEVDEGKVPAGMKRHKTEPGNKKPKGQVPDGMKDEKHGKVEEGETLEEETLEEEADQLDEAHVMYGHDEDAESHGVPQDRRNPTGGAGGGHKKAPTKAKVAKPGKMVAAKNAPGDAKLKPMSQTSHHSVKSGNIKASDEQGGKSNAPKKNNSQFEVVSESLEEENDPMDEKMYEEEMDAPEGGETPSDAAGESGAHKEEMKTNINNMLDILAKIAKQYGVEMDISRGDEGPAEQPEGGEEMAPPEGEEAMQEKLDEMVEKLTKRVAARLVKESKKRR